MLPDLRSKALELGCGHGIPGMALLLQQYEDVWFSDLNRDVITSYTWPNILKTCPEAATRATCASGDWAHLSEYLTEQNIFFDLIVSAETLYSQNTCKDVSIHHAMPAGGVFRLCNPIECRSQTSWPSISRRAGAGRFWRTSASTLEWAGEASNWNTS